MARFARTAGIVSIALMGPVFPEEVPLRPFPVDWSAASGSAIDLSGYLESPAGKDGHLRVRGAHIEKPDGSRFRFWGVNLCGQDCFPTKEEAALLAGDLARLGFNCVRFHHLDSDWGRSIFDTSRNDTRNLDPESLDRLDYLIAELKKRGIYSNINLNVHRRFKEGDGVRDFQILGIGKSATYFNDRLIELQHEYARQLLTHKNSYTGNEYRREPAVAVVEVVNENSVLEGWVSGRLVGADDRAGDTWSPIPVSYADELTDRYNRWLETGVPKDKLEAIRKEAGVEPGAKVPRLGPEQLAAASRDRFQAEASFYADLERTFFDGMSRLLVDELGVGSILVGTADHNDGISGYPHIASNLLLDVIDGHGYWEHPRLGKETWIRNTPMVNDPLDSTVTQLARTPVAGRPFTISEVNHPFPHEYACEGFPILTAYALFHDWDGIWWFTWGRGRHGDAAAGIQPGGWFDFSNDPVKLTNLAACGLIWHRRDIRVAERTVLRSYSREEIIETLRMDRDRERPFFTPGFARSTALEHATRFTLDGSLPSVFPPSAPPGKIVADTGEISWLNADRKEGLVTIVTERTEAMMGFVGAADAVLPHLAAAVKNRFCSLVLTSLDGKSLGRSERLLLAATALATNSGIRWKEDRQTLDAWGRGPVVIEPVVGTITVKSLRGVKRLRVRPLSPVGCPLKADLPVKESAGGWKISLGEPATTWCLLEPTR